MLTQIVLFGILISGSVWGSAVFKKRFEDLLPITCSMIIFVMFLFGVFGLLKQSVLGVLIIAGGLWIYSAIVVIKEQSWKEFMGDFITPAFCVFIVSYIVLTYVNYGMLAATWDEFSHWADIVKAMVLIDDFGTNPLAQSMFQSYPPGMSVFQYFFQKVFLLLNPEEMFSEWRLYFSYQILFLTFLMPFLRGSTFEKKSLKNIFNFFVAAILCCLGPMIIFDDIYIIILIDAFLGIIAGTGIAMIFVRENKEWNYDIYIFANLLMLVLAKDAGMLFAVFLLLTYALDNLFFRKEKKLKRFLLSVGGLASILIPKVLWTYNIKKNNAVVSFSNKVDIIELFKVIFRIDKTSYRVDVIKNFFDGLFNRYFRISEFDFKISYIFLFVVLIVASYIMYKKYNVWDRRNYRRRKLILSMFIIETVMYILGLCVTYMFKFSEYEAVGIASFERYMHIMLQGIVVFLLLIIVNYIINNEKQKYFCVCVLCVMLAILPWDMIDDVKDRQTVVNTVNTRVRYMPLIEKIEQIAARTDKKLNINVISQESAGYDGLILRYSLRPHNIVGSESIGTPFYEGDIWTVEKSAEEWKEELRRGVDYVALYHLNDYFIKEFSEVFQNPADIHENELYKVDKETGMLTLCVE